VLAAACEARLKVRNSARNHLLLSKALVKGSQWNQAAEQAEIALQEETNNVIPPMMLAAIALKEGKPNDDLSVVGSRLERASALIKAMPAGDEKTKRGRELLLNIAIYYALRNEPEKARAYVNEILKHYPDDETVREIANALN
jgi:Flp pilus assembly protein TadD